MKKCPNCGAANPNDAAFCGSCGTDLKEVPVTETAEDVSGGPTLAAGRGQQISISPQLIAIGVVGLVAVLCLLALIIVGLVGERTSRTTSVVIEIASSLYRLYAFLAALFCSYALVSRMDLTRLFSPVRVWMRFLVLLAVTGLLYWPLGFVLDRLFTFIARPNIVYSLERVGEAGLLVLVIGGTFWLLRRGEQQKTTEDDR